MYENQWVLKRIILQNLKTRVWTDHSQSKQCLRNVCFDFLNWTHNWVFCEYMTRVWLFVHELGVALTCETCVCVQLQHMAVDSICARVTELYLKEKGRMKSLEGAQQMSHRQKRRADLPERIPKQLLADGKTCFRIVLFVSSCECCFVAFTIQFDDDVVFQR